LTREARILVGPQRRQPMPRYEFRCEKCQKSFAGDAAVIATGRDLEFAIRHLR
jgi:hypothetical protein